MPLPLVPQLPPSFAVSRHPVVCNRIHAHTPSPAAEAGHAETIISQDAGHVFTLASSGVAGIQTTVAGVVYTALAASGSGSASNSAATSPRYVYYRLLCCRVLYANVHFSVDPAARLWAPSHR